MGKRSTFAGYLRQRAATSTSSSSLQGPTPATFKAFIRIDFDPTQASAGTGKFLPAGSVVIGVTPVIGGATGGASPTVDIGTEAAADAFANELAADVSGTEEVYTGSALGLITEDTEIFAGVGASAATGGSFTAWVSYCVPDVGDIQD